MLKNKALKRCLLRVFRELWHENSRTDYCERIEQAFGRLKERGGITMSLKGKRIGFGLTGSHCTYEEVFPQIEALISQGAEVRPVVTSTVQSTDTRFGEGEIG